MVSPFKIVFFDIDWTLYDHKNHAWSQSGIAGIQQLQKRGIKVILCTARPYHSLNLFGANSLGIAWDGYISSAGGVSYADGQYLRKLLLKEQDIEAFLALTKQHHLSCELVGPLERQLVFAQTYSSRKYYAAYHESIPERDGYHGQEVVSIAFFATKRWDNEYQTSFPQLVYSRFFPNAVDVMGQPHIKGEGCDVILQHYGFSKDEALGFGDDLQDISMAQHLGSFVCMGQGKDDLKAVSSFVSTPVWDDGVANGLRHYGLIS